MATTVKQFREYLATLPDDMPVEVLKEESANWQTWVKWVPLDLHPHTGNLYVGNNVLELGDR